MEALFVEIKLLKVKGSFSINSILYIPGKKTFQLGLACRRMIVSCLMAGYINRP